MKQMPDFQDLAIREALHSILGKTAKIWPYGRQKRTPMTFVLDEVERQIGSRFSVYWVDGGAPELFVLPGFSPSPVVFSTRYLSLTAFIRNLIVKDWLTNVLADVAERTLLKVMAEMALHHGDPDYAVLAFVKATTGKGIWLDDHDQVMGLEHEPIDEAYMATWFYGLAHELGHLMPMQEQHFSEGHILSDDWILAAMTTALNSYSVCPDSMKQEAIKRAKQQRANSVIGIDQLRSEGIADIFACSILFQTTFDIMHEVDQKRFEAVRFIQEMIIFLNIIVPIDRCHRVALAASATKVDQDAQFESFMHPASMHVRGQILLVGYLQPAVTAYLFNSDPTPEQRQLVENLINEITKGLAEKHDPVESGLAHAMEFSLFPDRRVNDWLLLEEFREWLPDSPLGRLEAQRFCDLATALGANGKLLRVLRDIVDDPSKQIIPDPKGDLLYIVPWVKGPDGFNRPFGLDTKYGHLVFVFHHQGDLYDAFFEASAEQLKPGFTLEVAAFPVPRKERLAPHLAMHMPEGKRFGIVVEGTGEFEQYLNELADDTIWEG